MNLSTHHISVSRTARYCISGEPETAEEVWFLLHGYGQLAEEFLRSCERLVRSNRLLVAPEALSRFYSKGFFGGVGASWMTAVGREEEVEDYLGYLDAVSDTVLSDLDAAVKVTVLGFSQGAATASRWVAMGSVPATRLICWAGDVAHDIADPLSSFSKVDLSMVFGTRDKLITPERKAEYLERLDATGLEYRLMAFEGGHRLDDALLAQLGDGS